MIFAYNILMLIVWFFFNILDVLSFICIYSLYLELKDLTKLQDLARLKVRVLKHQTGGFEFPQEPFMDLLKDIWTTRSAITVLKYIKV